MIRWFWISASAAWVAVILWAGLWPLDFLAPNGVYQLKNGDGLEFYSNHEQTQRYQRPGIVYTDNPVVLAPMNNDSRKPLSATIELTSESWQGKRWELWIQMCWLDSRGNEMLVVARWLDNIIVRVNRGTQAEKPSYREISIKAPPQGQKEFFAIVAGEKGIRLYLNGAESAYFPDVMINGAGDGTPGRLIFGADSKGNCPWSGKMYGASMYREPLRREVIRRHDAFWRLCEPGESEKRKSSEIEMQNIAAVYYDFAKATDLSVPDLSGRGLDLHIPRHFVKLNNHILRGAYLNDSNPSYNKKDILINMLGFVPLGIFGCGAVRKNRGGSNVVRYLLVLILGAVLSLGIELLQAWTPTRDSSLLDVICNCTGTLFGIVATAIFLKSFAKIRLNKRQ